MTSASPSRPKYRRYFCPPLPDAFDYVAVALLDVCENGRDLRRSSGVHDHEPLREGTAPFLGTRIHSASMPVPHMLPLSILNCEVEQGVVASAAGWIEGQRGAALARRKE